MAYIPIQNYSTEIEIKKSRFIGYGYPIESPEDARIKLKELRIKYSDARHICYAFVWGKDSTHMGMSDDGEPSGTAGRPMLEVVKGSGYENILVAAVRYFGGIKLGTGGLVKAYTEITQNIISDITVEKFVEKENFSISVPYKLYDIIKIVMEEHNVVIEKEEFLSDINIFFCVPVSCSASLKNKVNDISKGSLLFSKL